MKTLLLALPLAAALGAAANAQQGPGQPSAWVETRFHRVHLRNGNFIDGQLVNQSAKAVVLNLKTVGDFAVRRDQITRVEFIKIRSLREEPPVVPAAAVANTDLPPDAVKLPGSGAAVAAPAAPEAPGFVKRAPEMTGVDHIPAEIRKSVDNLLATYTIARSDLRGGLASQIRALGDDAMAYACLIAKRGRAGVDVPALIEAIGEWTHPDAMPTLLTVVASGVDSFDRQAAVKVLAQKGTPEAIAAVHRACGDPSGQVWRVAIEEVEKMAEKGKADVQLLIQVLQTARDKTQVAKLLGKLGGDEAIQALESLLGQDDPKAKIEALKALAPKGRAQDGDVAVGLVSNESAKIRQEACNIIGKMKHGPGVRKLIDALQDEDETVSRAAHWALGQITGLPFGPAAQRWNDWWDASGKTKFPESGEDK